MESQSNTYKIKFTQRWGGEILKFTLLAIVTHLYISEVKQQNEICAMLSLRCKSLVYLYLYLVCVYWKTKSPLTKVTFKKLEASQK